MFKNKLRVYKPGELNQSYTRLSLFEDKQILRLIKMLMTIINNINRWNLLDSGKFKERFRLKS